MHILLKKKKKKPSCSIYTHVLQNIQNEVLYIYIYHRCWQLNYNTIGAYLRVELSKKKKKKLKYLFGLYFRFCLVDVFLIYLIK